MKRVAIITSSDMGYQGKREDLSGPAIREIVEKEGYQVVLMEISQMTGLCWQKEWQRLQMRIRQN